MRPALAPLDAALATPSPWLLPYLPMLDQLLPDADSRSVAAALNAARCKVTGNLQFVEHPALRAGESYETFIARTACVPTRDNLHDLFNGLMWLSYPQTKRRLNRLQAQEIAQHGTTGSRGALRDALTLFDENAAVLQAPAALLAALRVRDWHSLFVAQRELWEHVRLVIFGHALLEKLMQPRKAITAHVWVLDELSDDALASSLTAERLAAKAFLSLPVLGVPGWCAANEEPAFYDDAGVFRSARPHRSGNEAGGISR